MHTLSPVETHPVLIPAKVSTWAYARMIWVTFIPSQEGLRSSCTDAKKLGLLHDLYR